MGVYQRRRPAPIKIYANPARLHKTRRQEAKAETPENAPSDSEDDDLDSPTSDPEDDEPDSASSVESSGPDSASSAGSQAFTTLGPDPTISSSSSARTTESARVIASSSRPFLPAQTTTNVTLVASSTNISSYTARPASGATAPVGEDFSENVEPDSPDSPDSPEFPSPTSSSQPTELSAPTATDKAPPRSELVGESSGIDRDPPRSPGHHITIGKGAEAALITSAVLGM
jgi:hypothetical protein